MSPVTNLSEQSQISSTIPLTSGEAVEKLRVPGKDYDQVK